jgi:putative transposase
MPHISIRAFCRLFHVNRAWYYRHQQLPDRHEANERIVQAIRQIVQVFPCYGYRRVSQALLRAGWQVSAKRVWKLMRQARLQPRRKRRYVRTTDSRHHMPVYPNLVKGLKVDAPNRCWVADITYVRLPQQFGYLACLVDMYSRKCVGWNLSEHLDTSLTLGALEMALEQREVQPGLIHHSDRGLQYVSGEYVRRLHSVQARISMSAKGCATDNAMAESFFKTVKYEEVYLHRYQTLEEARSQLQTFLEDVYNTKRLHSSLDYLPPDEFEAFYFCR